MSNAEVPQSTATFQATTWLIQWYTTLIYFVTSRSQGAHRTNARTNQVQKSTAMLRIEVLVDSRNGNSVFRTDAEMRQVVGRMAWDYAGLGVSGASFISLSLLQYR